MAAIRSADRFVSVMTVPIFLLICVVHAQRECEQPNGSNEMDGEFTLYKVAYDFNNDGIQRDCLFQIDDRTDPSMERGAFRYKVDKSVSEGAGHFITYPNNSRVYFDDAAPNDPSPVHYDKKLSGVTVAYFCQGTEQNTLVMYPYNAPLELAAKVEAELLSDLADDYKTNWDNCD